MTAITSNAYNFPNFIQSGVDPRTGTFSLSLCLGSFSSHLTSGATFTLTLHYNPASNADFGFGRGWALSLPSYSKANSLLSLSTGQSFKIMWNEEKNEYDMPYRRVKDIRVVYDDVTNSIIAIHKDGRKEIIDYKNGNLKEIVSPQGLSIHFSFSRQAGVMRLLKIEDGYGRVVDIDWQSSKTETVVSQKINEQELQRFSIIKSLSQNGYRLKSIKLPAISTPTTIFYEYEPGSEHDLIESVYHSTGMEEHISYQIDGTQLPIGAPIKSLPRVTRHRIIAGDAQPDRVTIYNYSFSNYLGFGSYLSWRDGEDNLFWVEKDYRYWVEETIDSGDGNVKSTKREYNKYHLMVKIEYRDNEKLYRADDNVYFAILDQSIDMQPANYMYIREESCTLYFEGGERKVSIYHEYDDYGNETKVVNQDGSIVEREFYPAAGIQDLCPQAPNGMVSLLRWEKFTPPPQYITAPKITEFTYLDYPCLNGIGSFIVNHVQHDKRLKKTMTYYNVIDKPLEYGRLQQEVLSINGHDIKKEYQYEFLPAGLKTSIYVTTHDGLQLSSSEISSYLHGNITELVDPDGVIYKVEYDAAGRQTWAATAFGQPEQAERTWVYSVGAGNNAITEIDGKKNIKMTHVNNAGKVISVEMATTGATLKVVQSCEYNAIGLLISQTNTDWLNGHRIDITTRYVHDENGEITEVIHADGRRETTLHNPVSLTSEYSLSGLMSEKTFFNLSGQETRKETRDSQGQVIATTDYRYDGYGNQIEIVDTEGRKINLKYDDFDRLVESTRYIDGQSIRETMTYPDFSDADMVESIAIDDIQLGTRCYDGLMRLREEVVANAKRSFRYEGSFQLPTQQIAPTGDIIDMNYNIPLRALKSRQVQGERNMSSIYKYDPVTGGISSHLNAACDYQLEIDQMGNLIGEKVYLNNGESKKATYTYSMAGRVLTNQDFIGNHTQWEYDEFLRPFRCSYTQPNGNKTTTTIYFDEFSRPCRYVSVSGEQETILKLDMSDIGLELARAISVNGDMVYESTSTYNRNQQLEIRVVHDVHGITTESYVYDDLSRLITYRCSGGALPGDGYGNRITEQSFTHDIYGNIKTCTTNFTSGESNLSRFSYYSDNPVRLERISNSHQSYPAETVFQYDNAGNVLNDESGLSYIYDVFGELTSVNSIDNNLSSYAYDANGRLVSQTVDSQPVYFYYQGDKLVNEVADNSKACYYYASPGLIKRTAISDQEVQHQQLYCNTQGSVIATMTYNSGEIIRESHTYTPYGIKTNEKNS